MRVLLFDVDSIWANLALMHISEYHKEQGDLVDLIRLSQKHYDRFRKHTDLGIKSSHFNFDKVYISCIFASNKDKALSIAKMYEVLGSEVEVGGSGIDFSKTLPDKMEHLIPDYDLYDLDYSMGFLTRGCIRNCPWCLIPAKEGRIKVHSPLKEFLHPTHRRAMLLDNNILSHPSHNELLLELLSKRLEVCFTQGLDIRLIDHENAKLLSHIKYRDSEFKNPRLYFSWDLLEIEDQVFSGLQTLAEHGIPPNRCFFYVLCGYGVEPKEYTWEYFLNNDWYRYERLDKMKAKPFIMKYNGRRDIPLLSAFTRWVDHAYKARKKSLGPLESFKTFLNKEYPSLKLSL